MLCSPIDLAGSCTVLYMCDTIHMLHNATGFMQWEISFTYCLGYFRYAVFGLGSRAYPNFCTFGHTCDNLLKNLGAQQIVPCGEGDELCGQEESFQVK